MLMVKTCVLFLNGDFKAIASKITTICWTKPDSGNCSQ